MLRYGLLALLAGLGLSAQADPAEYFALRVVDEQTGRGVPLIELRTTHNVRYYTDSAGYVAYHEPGLMGREVFFHVAGHGYEYPADGFGYRGVRLTPVAGESAEIKIKRLNIAERLYRITGAGIYRDSVLLGRPVPLAEPVLNGLVVGQDSVQTAVYRGRMFWFWGDTGWPAYPLGNFQMSGATSQLPGAGGLSPEIGVDLTYFVDERGFSKQMAPTPGPGCTWADGLVVLPDDSGRERLLATYGKVQPDFKTTRRGFLEYDDEEEVFKPIVEYPLDCPIMPGGHPLRVTEGDADWFYLPRPLPVFRVRATRAAYLDVSQYECFTCLKPGTTAETPVLDRAADGTLTWAWKRNAPTLLPQKQAELLKSGELKPTEARFRLFDVATGKPVIPHGASVYWNAYRGRYVAIVLEIFGTSPLGEIWLAEADTPLGPWRYARKVVTHDRYSFYNPKHHPEFDQEGGRIIYFEGTYTIFVSGNTDQTPRYDYNQIMYRLDLADPRLVLPVAVYPLDDAARPARFATRAGWPGDATERTPVFFALERPTEGCVAVFARPTQDDVRLETGSVPGGDAQPQPPPVFYALPADSAEAPAATIPLFEFTNADGACCYLTEEQAPPAGWHRAAEPLCRVWRLWP